MPSIVRRARFVVAVLAGAAVATTMGHFLAVDLCLDSGGRIADVWLSCETQHGASLQIHEYFGARPLLIVLISGVLAVRLLLWMGKNRLR